VRGVVTGASNGIGVGFAGIGGAFGGAIGGSFVVG